MQWKAWKPNGEDRVKQLDPRRSLWCVTLEQYSASLHPGLRSISFIYGFWRIVSIWRVGSDTKSGESNKGDVPH